MELLFWLSFALICYVYLGYPLCLALLRRLKPRPVQRGDHLPQVSVVLAACNEEGRIIRRIDNILAQDYPAARLEIVVVSDGSSDRTAEFARRAAPEQVTVVELSERVGKAAAVNAAVATARGEIVVFCDARQTFESDAIRRLAGNFADPAVGCVSGELLLLSEGEGGIQLEMGAYWKYEKWIRKAESESGSVIGATGAIYAIRRSLYRNLPQGALLDDVMTPMRVVFQGYRAVFDGSARAHDVVSKEMTQEWVRKVRTLAGNWQMIGFWPQLLLPWSNPYCWRFLSHKVLRLIVPFALVTLLLGSALAQGGWYRAMLCAQLLFYLTAAVGAMVPAARGNRAVNLSYFFFVMNGVAVAGFWRWATGRSAASWARPAAAPDVVKPARTGGHRA